MTTVRRALLILVLLVAGQLAFAHPPAERPAANAQRAAAVKADGLQVTGEHLNMWFTPVSFTTPSLMCAPALPAD
jgi:hypothetical protein